LRAEVFVIAAGGQETTRLLLRSAAVFSRLSAVPSALGRYYQGHVSGKIASVRFLGDPRATEYGFRREPDGSYQRRRFQFKMRAIAEHNLINTAFWLDNPLYFNPSHRNGAMSFMYLAMLMPVLGKKLAPPAVAYSITKGKVNRVVRTSGISSRTCPVRYGRQPRFLPGVTACGENCRGFSSIIRRIATRFIFMRNNCRCHPIGWSSLLMVVS